MLHNAVNCTRCTDNRGAVNLNDFVVRHSSFKDGQRHCILRAVAAVFRNEDLVIYDCRIGICIMCAAAAYPGGCAVHGVAHCLQVGCSAICYSFACTAAKLGYENVGI